MPYASDIQVINDANGQAYAFLADNGAIWQCQWDAEAQVWNQGSVVPLAFGGDKLQALYLDDLWPTSNSGISGFNPGIVLAYRVGEGNSAEIYASLGQWANDGTLVWSEPQQLTNDQVDDKAFSLVKVGSSQNGGFSLVVQKEQAAAPVNVVLDQIATTPSDETDKQFASIASVERPDSDLYSTQFYLNFANKSNITNLQLENSSVAGEANLQLSSPSPDFSPTPTYVYAASSQAIAAGAPLPFGANTQLSRHQLYNKSAITPPVNLPSNQFAGTAATTLSGEQTATAMESSPAPTTTSFKHPNYNGGAAGQFTEGGGSLRVGPLLGQDAMRWELNLPAYYFQNKPRLIEDDPQIDNEIEGSNSDFADELNELALVNKELANDGNITEASRLDNVSEFSEPMGVRNETSINLLQNFNNGGFVKDGSGNYGLNFKSRGIFGLGNYGVGGLSSFSGMKLILGVGDEEQASQALLLTQKALQNGSADSFRWNIGLGGSTQTIYEYYNSTIFSAPILAKLDTRASAGIDLSSRYVKAEPKLDGVLRLAAGSSLGWEWAQSISSSDKLPSWLADIGYAAGFAGDVERKFLTGKGIYDLKKSNSALVIRGVNGSIAGFEGQRRLTWINAGLGVALSTLGPAALLVSRENGTSLSDDNYSYSQGLQVGGRLSAAYLWYGLAGIDLNLGDRFTRYYKGANKGSWEDTLFVNAGVALPLGGALPILSYYHVWETEPSSTDQGAPTPPTSPSTVGGNSSTGLGATDDNTSAGLISYGRFIPAGTGASYPFAYAPATGSNSYFSTAPSGSGAALGAAPMDLQQLTLNTTVAGAVTSSSNSALYLYNPGAKLNDGQYKNVPILGLTISGSQDTAATANFTVQNGSIVASTLYISAPGRYLALPQGSPTTGTLIDTPSNALYNLVIDVFSQGIASPPAADQATKDPFLNAPIIHLDISKNPSLLTSQAIQAIESIKVPVGSQPAGIVYQPYIVDPNTKAAKISPKAANNNETYTYNNVPVIVNSSVTTSPIIPINLTAGDVATATVYLSNGIIKDVKLDQSFLFVPPASAGVTYSLELQLPEAVLPSGSQNPVYSVNLQTLGFNNFVDDDNFSAQVGASDRGVYLAAGISDDLPLTPGMGIRPVQNRVVYIDQSNNNIVYLNAINRYQLQDQPGVYKESLEFSIKPEQLSLGQYYVDANEHNSQYYFTAASLPTAVTIAGPKSANLTGNSFVAWVEAARPVTPISTPGDGSANYQAFMESLYGFQRINYRINPTGDGTAPQVSDLYPSIPLAGPNPNPVLIRHLEAFNVADPFSSELGAERTLLVWTETSIEALKNKLQSERAEPLKSSPSSSDTVIKVGWINPNPRTEEWNDLFLDSNGNSTIQTIPLDQALGGGLTIDDISIASLPTIFDGALAETPVLSWSQKVRTPYRQSVLDSNPVLYLELGQLQSGYSDINIGSVDSASTTTFASSTGLNFAVAGALSKSQATAVQNIDGTGVLSTGLGTNFTQARQVVRNINTTSQSDPVVVAKFVGSINGSSLVVSSLTSGTIDPGDLISGPGVRAGTTVKELASTDTAAGTTTYTLSQIQLQPVESTNLEALPVVSQLPISTFSGSISGSTLTVNSAPTGALSVGDLISGQGVLAGTFITAVNSVASNGGGTYTVSNAQSLPESSLVATPGEPIEPYSIEFWAKLQPSTNPSGAGLVALGQPSAAAVGAYTAPSGWLLSSSFVVDQISYQQALARGLITETEIPSDITSPSTTTYAWAWGVVADGADTTAMNGTGGSNLYSNSLFLNNLVSGATLAGMNQFLDNYELSAADLMGVDGINAATIASVPATQLQFNNFVDSTTGLPNSSLNNIAVDTSSALLNQGLMTVSELPVGTTGTNLKNMFTALWDFQQKTGEAKVNLNLSPLSTAGTTTAAGLLPDAESSEQYAGYELGFSLQYGPAVSVNATGQLVFDFGRDNSITSSVAEDLRDGNWHYVVASYLPTYQTYTVAGTVVQVPSNAGTASLYIDNKLAGNKTDVVNAYVTSNLNDQALLLANNVAGAIDQVAFYDKALTPFEFESGTSAGTSGQWPAPSTADALALLDAVGYGIATKTPNPGEVAGAVSDHWLARDVNPNDALLATYYSVFNPDLAEADAEANQAATPWSTPSNLNPALSLQSTSPSAIRPGSKQSQQSGLSGSAQNDLVIEVPISSWMQSDWLQKNSTSSIFFNPAGKQLVSVQVTLANSAVAADTNSFTLTPDQVFLGEKTLQSLQPFAAQNYAINPTAPNYAYTLLTNTPAFNLLIDRDHLSVGQQYDATYTFTFYDSQTGAQTSISNPAAVKLNATGSSVTASYQTAVVSTGQFKDSEQYQSVIATAAVSQQAPLQLKYIDSGVLLRSASSAAAASSNASVSPAISFGTSQVSGSFTASNGNQAGWLAIAQPQSRNATSDPAGRIWIQYTGQSLAGKPTDDVANAPSTWLNALAESNFSPDSPNLPLLGNADYPSSSGGLLIQADPTTGWGQNIGQNMLVADVNNDGIDDLVIAAPQANNGGCVYVIDGTWIQNTLINANTGNTILDLSNPAGVVNAASPGGYVTILTPATVANSTEVAAFGSALAFDSSTSTLWIGAPNYLQQLESGSTQLSSTKPIGALYAYTNTSGGWNSGQPTALNATTLGSGGTASTLDATGAVTTTYWGSQLGSAIAVDGAGGIAVSAPGVYAAMLYSGTQEVTDLAEGKKKPSNKYGDGALVRIGLPAIPAGETLPNVSLLSGTQSSLLVPIASQGDSSLSDEETAYMQYLKSLMVDNIADATVYYNQALQANAVGAVYYLKNSGNLQNISHVTASGVSEFGGSTVYGPNPWNVLGSSGFGSSLAFGDLTNKNNDGSILSIGADQAGGSGAVYLIDTKLYATATSQLGQNQYLAHLVSGLTLYGAQAQDSFGSGLTNLGDVNSDGYDDLLIRAFNASSGAGNGYVLFGSDNLVSSKLANPGTGNVAPGSIGNITLADGSTFSASILSELGYGSSAYTGQGNFGSGDVNGDGINDVLLGSGPNGNSYLTWGHPYLEAISNLQLSKLASNTGYMLDGLATTSQGSLRSIGDFNNDGYGDFISINPGVSLTTVRIELGANTQEILADAAYNYYTFQVANGTDVLPGGDVNGDGMDDIVLFIDQNLSSTTAGNRGAGSTTGILYGRASSELPLGSGFGLIAPVEPITSAPLMSLPGLDVSAGLTDATPSFISVGNAVYGVVKSNTNNSLYFTQSSDGGNSWSTWTNITSSQSGLASSDGPSLAYFNDKLYLSFVNSGGTLSLSSWDPTSNNPAAWSAPYEISNSSYPGVGFQSYYSPQLIDRGDALGIAWVGPSPADWSTLIGFAEDSTPAMARSGNTIYMATLGSDGRVQWASSTDEGATWSSWKTIQDLYAYSAPSLAVVNGTLYLSTIDDDTLTISSLAPGSNTWGTAVTFYFQGKYATLITEAVGTAQQLSLYAVADYADGTEQSSGGIFKYYSQTPDNSSSWNNFWIENLNASGLVAATTIEGQTFLAYQGGTLDNPSNSIYLAQGASNLTSYSSDGWSTEIAANPGTRTGVGLASFGQDLALSYADSSTPSTLTIALFSQQSGAWAESHAFNYRLPEGFYNKVSLLNLDDTSTPELFLAGVGSNSTSTVQISTLQPSDFYPTLNTSYSTTPDATSASGSWSSPYQLLERLETSGVKTYQPIAASAAPAVAWLGPIAVVAVNDNGAVNIYASNANAKSWQLVSTFTSAAGSPTIVGDPELVTTDTGLALTYTNSDGSITLHRLDLLRANGEPLPGVLINADGSISFNGPDLQWKGVTLTAANSGISSSLGSVPLSVDGSLLLANVRNSTSENEQIWLNAVPNGSDPESTTWLNSAVQLADSNSGWSISQQVGGSGVAQNLTSAQTGSTLTAAGDLDQDGFDDLLITANNVVATTPAGQQQLATGLRVIRGASTSSALSSLNDNTRTSQSVHLAAAFSLGSATPGSVISGAHPGSGDVGRGTLTLGLAASKGSSVSSLSQAVSGAQLTRRVKDVTEANTLFAGPTATQQSLSLPKGWGQQALNGTGAYGDLNGDGALDYFNPAGNNAIATIQGLSFSLWSIRAAGDANGNGVDDVLLSLAPQGPAYVDQSNGQPSALMSALVDGSVFKVDRSTNSFRLDQLKAPLDPYNRGELYDVTSTSNSDYVPLLQNWFVPILGYEPGSLTAATGTATAIGSSNNLSLVSPAVVVSPEGEIYYVFPAYTGVSGLSKSGSNLVFANQNSADGSWVLTQLPTSIVSSGLTPSAVYYQGRLTIAYTSSGGDLYVSWYKGGPVGDASSWGTYQVITAGGESSSQDESSSQNPTLVAESGRLALYFPSNNSGTLSQPIRYLYSTDPFNEGSSSNSNGNWGSSLNSTGSGYTGLSQEIAITGTSSTNPIATSQIAATTFQGRTVLAYRSFDTSAKDGTGTENGTIQLLSQVASPATSSSPDPSLSWVLFDTAQDDSGGVGLTTDQSLLYLTSAPMSGTVGSSVSSKIWSLSPSATTPGDWTMGSAEAIGGTAVDLTMDTTTGELTSPPNVINPFVVDGKLMVAWTKELPPPAYQNPDAYQPSVYTSQYATLDVTVGSPAQQSLAGYSLDGNIDVNGDGFTDVLISDPSDPGEGVDNQYVLFGGDYLDIATQVGTAGNDTLIGTPLADVIYTIGGADVVQSNGGADVIYTGSGDDQLSITGNAFIRIDAGSGFDQLLLEGQANQAYDFRLNVPSPAYFAGTKLRGVELISSQDYGSNVISLDLAAINAINPDRILFLAPDANDSIALSAEFRRDSAFDTSYGGSLWHAYAAGGGTEGTTNPALVYVLVPDGQLPQPWLGEHVVLKSLEQDLTSAPPVDADAAVVLPIASNMASKTNFGNGLTLSAFRSSVETGVARFRINRTGDLSKSQLVRYASTSQDSLAEPGRDYTAVAGLLRFNSGEDEADIVVPIDVRAMGQLSQATLSLQVNEERDQGQQAFHVLINSLPDAGSGLSPTISGFSFENTTAESALLTLRADTNSTDADNLRLRIGVRDTADASAPSTTKDVAIRDFSAADDFVLAKGSPKGLPIDHDASNNGQVSVNLRLNLNPTPAEPMITLVGPTPEVAASIKIVGDQQLRFDQDVSLTTTRADSGTGAVTFSLVAGELRQTLLSDASGGTLGSINGANAFANDPVTGLRSSEGLAIGSRSVTTVAGLSGQSWTPTASRDGVLLKLIDLRVNGSQVTADFEGGVTGVIWQSMGTAPTVTPVAPSLQIQRMGVNNNAFGLYSVDDITGTVDGYKPGESGYLQAALQRSEREGLYLSASMLPEMGGSASFESLPINTLDRYGMLLVQNGDRSSILSSFSGANPGGLVQMISLTGPGNVIGVGIEDLTVKNRSDQDFNDLVAWFQNVEVQVF